MRASRCRVVRLSRRLLHRSNRSAARVGRSQLHKHFEYIRGIATNERTNGEPKPTVDGTLPDAAFLEGRAAQVRSFQQAFELPDEAPATSGGGASKKPKVES